MRTRTLILLAVFLLSLAPALAQDARHEPSFEEITARAASLKRCKAVDMGLVAFALQRFPALGEALAQLAWDPSSAPLQNDVGNRMAELMLFELAHAAYLCSIENDKRFGPAWNNIGIIYLARGEISKAQDAFQRTTQLDPNNAMAFYHLAMAYDRDNQYDRAIQNYEHAVTLDPRLASVRNNPEVVRNPHQLPLFLRRMLTDQAVRYHLQESGE